jgi:hypothetical protein
VAAAVDIREQLIAIVQQETLNLSAVEVQHKLLSLSRLQLSDASYGNSFIVEH